MSKVVKEMIVDRIRERLGDCRDVLVVDVSALDANTNNKLRAALREKGIDVLQVKNSLARRALEDAGVSSMGDVLEGPSALAWGSEDIVALSKEITRWTKELDKFEVKGGAVEGEVVDADGVRELSKSPGRLELIGQIVGLALSPGAQIVGALLGPGSTVVGQLEVIADKEEDGEGGGD